MEATPLVSFARPLRRRCPSFDLLSEKCKDAKLGERHVKSVGTMLTSAKGTFGFERERVAVEAPLWTSPEEGRSLIFRMFFGCVLFYRILATVVHCLFKFLFSVNLHLHIIYSL